MQKELTVIRPCAASLVISVLSFSENAHHQHAQQLFLLVPLHTTQWFLLHYQLQCGYLTIRDTLFSQCRPMLVVSLHRLPKKVKSLFYLVPSSRLIDYWLTNIF